MCIRDSQKKDVESEKDQNKDLESHSEVKKEKTIEDKFAEYDEDGDGIVSDEELSHIKAIKETETALRKNLALLRMARYTLIAMGTFTAAMFFVPLERVQALADISNLFYISGAGIVGAYMGTTAWMARK